MTVAIERQEFEDSWRFMSSALRILGHNDIFIATTKMVGDDYYVLERPDAKVEYFKYAEDCQKFLLDIGIDLNEA
jgi:hypothetical protein